MPAYNLKVHCQGLHNCVVSLDSGGGQGVWEKGCGRCTGDGSRGGGSEILKVAGQEVGEIGKIMQYCIIFCNSKSAKEPTEIGWELGLRGMGSGKFKPPFLPPPPH